MNTRDICKQDNKLQKQGKYKTQEIKEVHEAYREAINEDALLEKLMKKYNKG